MNDAIKTFANTLVYVLYIAIFARVILSWLPIGGAENPLVAIVYQITEPILRPIRSVIPRLGIFDLTPMIAIVLLELIRNAVNRGL